MYSTKEVMAVSKDFKKCADFINNTKVDTNIALHYSSLCFNMFETQPVVGDFKYDESLKNRFYKPLINLGLRPDVIDEEANLEKYKILFSPLMLTLDQGDLRARIAKWVENGGIWVTGPMTDIRTNDGTRFKDRLHGMLESLTPAVFKYWFPDKEKRVSSVWKDGEEFGGNTYYEIFEPDSAADIVNVKSGHKEIIGGAVLQRFPVGKGFVYVLGTLPDKKDADKLIKTVLKQANIDFAETQNDSIIVSPRAGENTSGVILADVCGKGGIFRGNKEYKDIISERVYKGDITLKPYEVLVLKEIVK